MKNKSKKYILGLVIVILIAFSYYTYIVNRGSNYKPPYVYTGETYAYTSNNKTYKGSNDDWCIEYSLVTMTKNNASEYYNDYKGMVTLTYKGNNIEVLKEISELTIYMDAGLAGIPSVTWKKEGTNSIVSGPNKIGINYVNEQFTPKYSMALDSEIYIKLEDGTNIDYYGVITVGPKNILNFQYIKSRYF